MSEIQDQLLDMYRTMLTIRRFEERCNDLYMQGRIPSTLHLYIGQEAVAAVLRSPNDAPPLDKRARFAQRLLALKSRLPDTTDASAAGP